ncbi:MAG: hypothetical protein WC911_02835 [Thermoleophilia bacterium]
MEDTSTRRKRGVRGNLPAFRLLRGLMMKYSEYSDLENALRQEAMSVSGEDRTWTSLEVSQKLAEIADVLKSIGSTGQGGINASMGKRSGWKVDI